jgi:hypothetical protein
MLQLQSSMDPAQWAKANAEYARIIQKAEKGAIHDVGIAARDAVRKMVAEAGFGKKWSNSFRAKFGVNNGSLYNPFALIFSTISYAGIFETGGTIAGKPFLWLPTDNVPPIAGRPHMTPKEYVQNVGPLVTMRLPGRVPMLGAQVRVRGALGRNQFIGRRARLRRGLSGRGDTTQTIPMFVGISAVTIPKKWDVHGTVAEEAKGINEAYEKNLEKYDGGA